MTCPFPGMDPYLEGVPLREPDPDVPLDLQQAFTTIYELSPYGRPSIIPSRQTCLFPQPPQPGPRNEPG